MSKKDQIKINKIELLRKLEQDINNNTQKLVLKKNTEYLRDEVEREVRKCVTNSNIAETLLDRVIVDNFKHTEHSISFDTHFPSLFLAEANSDNPLKSVITF